MAAAQPYRLHAKSRRTQRVIARMVPDKNRLRRRNTQRFNRRLKNKRIGLLHPNRFRNHHHIEQ